MNNIKIGRKKQNREHLVRNLTASLILYESVKTTTAKSKLVKQSLDRLISRCKPGGLKSVRLANAYLFDKNAAKKLIIELIPRYKDRISGFAKTYKIDNKIGDNSEMTLIELVDKKKFVKKDDGKEQKPTTK